MCVCGVTACPIACYDCCGCEGLCSSPILLLYWPLPPVVPDTYHCRCNVSVCMSLCLSCSVVVCTSCLSLACQASYRIVFSSYGWIGLDWIGLDWIGLDCIGLDWIGLDWIGLDWIALDCIGLDCIGLDWKYIPILVAIVQYYWYTLIAMPLARCIAYIVSLTGRVYRHQPNYTLLQSEWNYRECVNKVNATRLSIASAGNSSALLSRAKSEAF
jgi:hypothetical protein